jgi:hypothetical protein
MVLASIRAIMTKPSHAFILVGCVLIRGTSSRAGLLLAPVRLLGPGNDLVVQNFCGADVILKS